MEKQAIIEDLTLILLHLTSFSDGKKSPVQKAWKEYDFDALDALKDEGFLLGSSRAKSVVLTEDGKQRAQELLEQYGFEIDPAPSIVPSFRFHVQFVFDELICTRDLLIPKHTSFEDFHTMLQACFNWMNYHLYNFTLTSDDEPLYISYPDYETGEDPRESFGLLEDDRAWRDSREVYLDDFFPKTKSAIYSYDYGDGWEIAIELLNYGEKIYARTPVCADGNGDAPPEDVGGEGGFEYFLEVIEDSSNPDYDRMNEWGESQGFERFDNPRRTNRRLSRWSNWAQIID